MRRDRNLLDRLSTEARLLLLAAGPSHTDAEMAELCRARPVDWSLLLQMADRERATGVLWRRLRPFVPDTVGASLREPFERMALIADFNATYLAERLGETLAVLNAAGVEALLLKGAALAVSDYKSFAERPMGDVDLVIAPERANEAFAACQAAGWRWDAAAYPRERYAGHHHLPPLLDASGMDVRLEVHTGLFVDGSPFGLDASRVEREGRRVAVGKGQAVIPSREHLLLHTCIHYTWSHMMLFGAWRAFRDVIAVSAAGLDWDRFVAESERSRASSSCFWTLRLAERLAGALLPPKVMERLARSTSPSWLGVIERHAAREMFPSPDRCPSQWLRRRLWELAILPGAAGHGDARPWLLDDLAPENLDPEGREGGVVRVARQIPRLGAWVRYARALAG